MRGVALTMLAAALLGSANVMSASPLAPLEVDPEVRALASSGRARALVVLRVPEGGDEQQRIDAIARAQDAVLGRLPGPHASVVRRYASVPMLALEIDATALRALEAMADFVAAVKPDRTMVPQ